MRSVMAGLWGMLALIALQSASSAQESCAPDALGVSRIAEIDAKGAPWFGTPRGDPDFLAPGEVVLTFDDGPMAKYTRPILAALAAQCTKATFFMLGEMAAEYPEVVKDIAEQGHTIGTHTWSHANLRRLGVERATVEIESAFTTVEKAATQPIAPFFRFPYLSESDAVATYLKDRNVAIFAVDVDSFDWRTHDAKSVIRRVMSGLQQRGKGIILFHDIHPSTVGALPELLAQLKAKGFKIVHLRPREPVKTLAFEPPAKSATQHARRRGHAARRHAYQGTFPGIPAVSW
jgi:peptidoglycan/xylan/chitin deacetylase (PgdA/CDA1 family)